MYIQCNVVYLYYLFINNQYTYIILLIARGSKDATPGPLLYCSVYHKTLRIISSLLRLQLPTADLMVLIQQNTPFI